MNIYYDKDADLSLIQSKKVTIIGYGFNRNTGGLGLTGGCRAWAKPYTHIYAGILQVVGMGVPLGTIANDGNVL